MRRKGEASAAVLARVGGETPPLRLIFDEGSSKDVGLGQPFLYRLCMDDYLIVRARRVPQSLCAWAGKPRPYV